METIRKGTGLRIGGMECCGVGMEWIMALWSKDRAKILAIVSIMGHQIDRGVWVARL